MNITLYSFSKKKNSTKIPADSGTTISNVNLKDDTSLLSPVFKLTNNGNLNSYNYVAWNGRYYFISDIVKRNNNIIEIACSIDVLASWRTAILNSSQFVDRSASSYDSTIKDGLILSSDAVIQTLDASTAITGWSESGRYVVRIAGASGGTMMVHGTRAQIQDLMSFGWSSSIKDAMVDSFTQFFFDPLQYILNVMWFPIDSIPSGSQITVALGYWNSGIGLYQVGDGLYNPTFSVTIPATTYYGDYRDYDNEFTKVILYLPCYGTYELPSEYIGQTVSALYCVDFLTGACNIILKINNTYIADVACQIGVPIQISQGNAINVGGQISNAISATGNLLSQNVAGLVDNVQTGITTAFQPLTVQKGSIGNKSFTLNDLSLRATVIRKGSSGVPTTRCGRVLNQQKTISTLSGYCKCINGVVDIGGLESEKDMISTYLNSGFYIE